MNKPSPNAKQIEIPNPEGLFKVLLITSPKNQQRELAALIFQDEITKFMDKHQIKSADLEKALNLVPGEQMPFTRRNVDRVCEALSLLAGVEFETFNNLKS